MYRTHFAKNPMDRETWARYRRLVLEPGGSHSEPFELIREFLSRPHDVGAFFDSLKS